MRVGDPRGGWKGIGIVRYIMRVAFIALIASLAMGAKAQTPPIQPKVQETPLPPPVELEAPPTISPDVPNRPLTASEAAAIALRHQPNVTVARADVYAAQGRKRQAQAGLLPTVNTGAAYANTAIIPTTGPSAAPISGVTSPGYQVTANVEQLIYDFNHTRDLVRQASAEVSSATSNLTRVQSDTVLQVKQAFYTYGQDQRLVSVNEANVGNQQSHLALASAQLQAGMGLPSDVVRAETAVADAIFSLNVARNNASLARVNLALLMGVDPRTPINAADTGEPPIKEDSANSLVNLALKQRPEIQQANADLQAAIAGVSAAKNSDYPSLGAGAGWLQTGSNFPLENNSLTYGVAVHWTPFNSGLTKGLIQEAQANLLSVQAQMQTAQLQVTSDVSQAYLNLITAQQRVTTADSEVANAQEALNLTEGRYKSGLGTFLDVLDAQQALVTAKSNLVNAQSAVDQALAATQHAIGASLKLES